jgi:F-type H+-transporting ATPase subunit delta
VISAAILGRYAKSLSDVVFEENVVEKVTEDLKTYSEIFHAVPDVLETFDSPAVPRETKENLLRELTARYPVHSVASNFLRILLDHNRIRFFQEIRDAFLQSVHEQMGMASAQVTAAAPLSQQEMISLEKRLSAMTGKLVTVESQTDPSLLGGMVVQMGSTVFDGSIRTQLADIKRRFMET